MTLIYLVLSHILLKVSQALTCPSYHVGREMFSVVSILFLGLIQREHMRSQKVGVDTGH